jgi:hypothetical protein
MDIRAITSNPNVVAREEMAISGSQEQMDYSISGLKTFKHLYVAHENLDTIALELTMQLGG